MFLFLLFVFVDDLQPDLSGNPFAAGNALAKRLGAEGGHCCHKKIKVVLKYPQVKLFLCNRD